MFLAISAATMLFVSSTAAVSVSANSNESSLLTATQENDLSSYFELRGQLLKNNSENLLTKASLNIQSSVAKSLHNKDEAVGLVNLMEDVHGKSLSDYQVDYTIKDIQVIDGKQVATAELYQIFTWAGSEVTTEFKDEVQIVISPAGEFEVGFPQLDVTADELVSNARELNKQAKLDKGASSVEDRADLTAGPTIQAVTYNRTAVRDYIDTYWDNYNPDYTSYSNDCTNFASQAIHAGGVPMYIQSNGSDENPSWYYNVNASGWLRSLSWINVDELFDLMRNYSTIDASASNVSSVAIGDIVQYDKGSDGNKDHTAIVSRTETPAWDPTQRFVYVSYHTTDRHNVSWDFYPSNYANTSSYFTKINNTQS